MLRDHWRAAQESHWRAIFAEPVQPDPFGVRYFEALLRVGARHNQIDTPLKWYLGSYPPFLDAVRAALREHPPLLATDVRGRASGRARRHA
ncbi:MAG: protoglobin domain-containing protein, partial [Solirubrobacteraceae bacterium]